MVSCPNMNGLCTGVCLAHATINTATPLGSYNSTHALDRTTTPHPISIKMASEKNNPKLSPDGSMKDEEFATTLQPTKLHRQLKNRHVAMIRCASFLYPPFPFSHPSSIGGVIGTGLFVGTANSLAHGGPVGLLLGYITMGTIVLAVMVGIVTSPVFQLTLVPRYPWAK